MQKLVKLFADEQQRRVLNTPCPLNWAITLGMVVFARANTRNDANKEECANAENRTGGPMKQFLKIWLNDWIHDENEASLITGMNISDANKRTISIAIIFFVAYVAYGVSSMPFLKVYDSNINFSNNILPRILFNSIPLALWTFFLHFVKNEKLKLHLWIVGFLTIFQVACWINVWPIALKGHSDIFLYVHSANVFTFSFIPVALILPNLFIVYYYLYLLCIVLVPLFIVVQHSGGGDLLFNVIIGDILLLLTVAAMVASGVNRALSLKERVIQKIKKTVKHKNGSNESSDDSKDYYIVDGFVMDLRFKRFTIVSNNSIIDDDSLKNSIYEIATKYGGALLKQSENNYLCYFGIDDRDTNLDEINDRSVEADRSEAHERGLKSISFHSLKMFSEIFDLFNHTLKDFTACGGLDMCKVIFDKEGKIRQSSAPQININIQFETGFKNYFAITQKAFDYLQVIMLENQDAIILDENKNKIFVKKYIS